MINITVNGESKQTKADTTVATLLDTLNLPAGKVAAEINRIIIPKSDYADTLLHDGDAVEIIHFIGGG